ncbi:unnamed protein product [Didymodactylos carnosus]|uniref:Uncharacterized protein n=1 Tax=Didymodactylos carnosus TaxID=1234261 RepID=A0A814LRH2_9BILA|nr:unnamed protein product [Didymodactylos carnosus]CAF1068647.1 unnamed protein product [Didymodactylos carnosus]CAF3674819.1 unnamed protein product [Didymodactylos carnosus]CAF3835976.1 unnamed protein product [Didymodactylos carnosus]
MKLCQAEIKRKKKGVISLDPLIDRNPDQLWRYFMTYLNEKPQLKVNILGYYTEYYTETETYTDYNGKTQFRSVLRTRNTSECNFSIDLSPYISEQWWRTAIKFQDSKNVCGILLLYD